MASSSMQATGMGITAGLTMITTGTRVMIGTASGTTIMVETRTSKTIAKCFFREDARYEAQTYRFDGHGYASHWLRHQGVCSQ